MITSVLEPDGEPGGPPAAGVAAADGPGNVFTRVRPGALAAPACALTRASAAVRDAAGALTGARPAASGAPRTGAAATALAHAWQGWLTALADDLGRRAGALDRTAGGWTGADRTTASAFPGGTG